MPAEIYEQALSEAADLREQSIVQSCQMLEGKRNKPSVKPDTIQIMQEVLFESEAAEVRAAVAAGLGNAGSITSMPKLIDAMEDDALVARQAAAAAVGKLMGWYVGFNADDSPEVRAEAVEQFRERWMLFEASDLYQVATDPEARERAEAIAEKRAKFLRRKERSSSSNKDRRQSDAADPAEEFIPQRQPTAAELLRQFPGN